MKHPSQEIPTKNEPWVKLFRDLIRSDAWRSAGINARRFIDFLMSEHMSHGAKENGKLKAPFRQLVAFGISSRHLADYIREAEELGLVVCKRQGQRAASLYRLTWLEGYDKSPPTDEWRAYRNPALRPFPQPKIRNLPAKVSAGLPAKVSADGPNLPAKVSADDPKSLPAKVSALSRISSYQGGEDTTDLSVGAARSRLRVVNP